MQKTCGRHGSGLVAPELVVIGDSWTYYKSADLAKHEGGHLLIYKDALELLMGDKDLLERLKGKWFWLEGRGLGAEQGVNRKAKALYTLRPDGTFKPGKGSSVEDTISISPGTMQLWLDIRTDQDSAHDGCRFMLHAGKWLSGSAKAVVVRPDPVLFAIESSRKAYERLKRN